MIIFAVVMMPMMTMTMALIIVKYGNHDDRDDLVRTLSYISGIVCPSVIN